MNTDLFHIINGWAGESLALDMVIVFGARYLIYVLFATAAICMGVLIWRRNWRPVILFVTTLAVAFGLLIVTSQLYPADRPFIEHDITQLISHDDTPSFPSNHMTSAFTIALALLVFTRYKKIGWTAIVVACAIGFSRIFAGVHYPLDILGAVAVGLVATVSVYGLNRLIIAKRTATTHTSTND